MPFSQDDTSSSESQNRSDVSGENSDYNYYEYSNREESIGTEIHPKWRKTPRAVGDFYESVSRVSSCKDIDYEAWLEKYYVELFKEKMKKTFFHVATDTADLIETIPENILTSFFQSIEKDVWSYSTKYWGPKDTRRHWPLRIQRGKYLFLPSIHPHLNLRSRYGRFHSLLNSAAAIPEDSHKRFVCGIFKKILQNFEGLDPQLQKFMLCDDLCNLRWFDYLTNKAVFRCFCRLLRKQANLEKVYLENISMDRLGGISLLCALSTNGGGVVKELHLWKMFAHGQCPTLLNELSSKGDFLPSRERTKYFTRIHYLQILNKFTNLTHLSMNYSYLANRAGDALLSLKCVRLGCLESLRLLCLMDERPLQTNPGYGVGGFKIADGVWRRAVEWCPHLRVSFVFLNMAQYENVILFLSKSIPVSNVNISSGIDFTFNVPWDIDSTLLELRNWYANTLESLSLHLWHHRDLLDFVIRRKILEEFPNLINFEFIGVLENVETLHDFCCQLSKGIYKLKTLLFWVEEKHTNPKELSRTRKRVDEIRSTFKKKFKVLDIDADLQTYAL